MSFLCNTAFRTRLHRNTCIHLYARKLLPWAALSMHFWNILEHFQQIVPALSSKYYSTKMHDSNQSWTHSVRQVVESLFCSNQRRKLIFLRFSRVLLKVSTLPFEIFFISWAIAHVTALLQPNTHHLLPTANSCSIVYKSQIVQNIFKSLRKFNSSLVWWSICNIVNCLYLAYGTRCNPRIYYYLTKCCTQNNSSFTISYVIKPYTCRTVVLLIPIISFHLVLRR